MQVPGESSGRLLFEAVQDRSILHGRLFTLLQPNRSASETWPDFILLLEIKLQKLSMMFTGTVELQRKLALEATKMEVSIRGRKATKSQPNKQEEKGKKYERDDRFP